VPAIGVTGGVGTGKSSFLRAFVKQMACDVFDADACVHELLAGDLAVLTDIRSTFGGRVFAPDGSFSRPAMRDLAFHDEEVRRKLEAILHPAVYARWKPMAVAARESSRVLLLDIPLLYETSAEVDCDRVLVVACAPGTQRERLLQKRGLAPELIERMIEAQLDLAAKVDRADHVVWNDGSPSALDEQARLFAAFLRETYG
jgi:dephospho-CoA kinase